MMTRVVLVLSCLTMSLLCPSGVPAITVFVYSGVSTVRVVTSVYSGIKFVILARQ